MFKRLITYADDYGRFNADTEVMRAKLYAREIDSVTEHDIFRWMVELSGVGKIVFYRNSECKEKVFCCFPNWDDHQRVRNLKKKNPDPEDFSANDEVLKYYVPYDLKFQSVLKNDFKCDDCGWYVTMKYATPKRLFRLSFGLLDVVKKDIKVEATMKNVKVICESCQSINYNCTLNDAVDCGKPQQVAAELMQENIGIDLEKKPDQNKKQDSKKSGEKQEEYSADFEEFWKEYPRRKEKKRAYRCWLARIKEKYSPKNLVISAINYSNECRYTNKETEFIKLPATFLGRDKPFEEYINKGTGKGQKPAAWREYKE